MDRWPHDIPKRKAIRTLAYLGFKMVREEEHIAMVRENANGTKTPLTMPNHPCIKGSTLCHICTQSGISRKDFLTAYRKT
jgi:hypothetical protein